MFLFLSLGLGGVILIISLLKKDIRKVTDKVHELIKILDRILSKKKKKFCECRVIAPVREPSPAIFYADIA